jgi:hypothetical protein
MVSEARDVLHNLPRIEIRIEVGEDPTICGSSFLNSNILTIYLHSAKLLKAQLRVVVWHEICHAVLGIEHVEGCPLMSPKLGPLPTLYRLNSLLWDYSLNKPEVRKKK